MQTVKDQVTVSKKPDGVMTIDNLGSESSGRLLRVL